MDFLALVVAWFADPGRWSGPDGIPMRVAEHLLVSGGAVGTAALLALPVGSALGHAGRGGFLAIDAAGIGRALPSFAVLALVFIAILGTVPGLAFTFWPTFLAMVPLALPPILTNAYVAIRSVDRETVDAARGMGMREAQILLRIEVPLALPLMLAGVRTAAVAVIATATLGAVVAGPGLGRYIWDGLALQEYERMFAGAVLVALLAVGIEVVFATFQRVSARSATTA